MSTSSVQLPCTRRRSSGRRGAALVLVIAAVGLAALLGFAMLASAALQSHASSNAARSLAAEYLAESGINLAMYYAQHPQHAPALNANGYWPGTGGQSTVGSTGTVEVTMVRNPNDEWVYEVTSIGRAGSADARITRTAHARLNVRSEYRMKAAAGFNLGVTLFARTEVDGDLWTDGVLTLRLGSKVTGTAYCDDLVLLFGASEPEGGWAQHPFDAPGSPTNLDVNLYATYLDDGQAYSADVFPDGTTSLTGVQGVVTYGPTASNPAGVWHSNGNIMLMDDVTIDGTLVVIGNCVVNGKNILITPKPGFPALIVTGNLEIRQQGRSIVVDGICYVGTTLRHAGSLLSASSSSTLTINGGLLIGATSGSPISNGYNVTTHVNLDPSKALAPDLSSVGRSPIAITVERWGPPGNPTN